MAIFIDRGPIRRSITLADLNDRGSRRGDMASTIIEAVNTAPDSPNRIHTEEAKQYGFRGGIVPGLTLYAYVIEPLVDLYGTDWLGHGQVEVSFRRPVYDGERLTISLEPNGNDDDVELEITKDNGEVCVRGSARRHRDDRVIDVADYPAVELGDGPLPDGTPEVIGALPQLAEWELDTSREYVDAYLAQIGATHEVFQQVLQPAVVARVSAYIVGRRFNFGPRIHVGVRSRFLAAAPRDARLTGRGRIVRTWEKKSNHYFESDLLVVDEHDQPVMQIDSRSLYQLGSGGNG